MISTIVFGVATTISVQEKYVPHKPDTVMWPFCLILSVFVEQTISRSVRPNRAHFLPHFFFLFFFFDGFNIFSNTHKYIRDIVIFPALMVLHNNGLTCHTHARMSYSYTPNSVVREEQINSQSKIHTPSTSPLDGLTCCSSNLLTPLSSSHSTVESITPERPGNLAIRIATRNQSTIK